jgi:transposase
MTFLAALRHDRIDAPWFIEGPIDGASFRAYVEKVLLPTLRPGDVVVMDNLGSHKGKIVRQLIRSAGAKLFFLPKYSPDLNPIEQVFGQAQASAPKGCRPNRRYGLHRHRSASRRLHSRRMRQLPHKLRLSKLMPSRSKAAPYAQRPERTKSFGKLSHINDLLRCASEIVIKSESEPKLHAE